MCRFVCVCARVPCRCLRLCRHLLSVCFVQSLAQSVPLLLLRGREGENEKLSYSHIDFPYLPFIARRRAHSSPRLECVRECVCFDSPKPVPVPHTPPPTPCRHIDDAPSSVLLFAFQIRCALDEKIEINKANKHSIKRKSVNRFLVIRLDKCRVSARALKTGGGEREHWSSLKKWHAN